VNGVNGLFKLAFHAPRPYWVSLDIKGLATETSYGLPSGHAAIASSCWLLMARRLHRTWAVRTAVIVVLLISLSRLFLGVHFPTDVLGGLVVGVGMLVLYETAGRHLVARFGHATLGAQMVWSAVVPAVLLIWRGLAVVLPQGAGLVTQIGRFIRYALTGVWTVYVAPVVFLRTGLALPAQHGNRVGRSENDTKGHRES
jgi:hypothetical protein